MKVTLLPTLEHHLHFITIFLMSSETKVETQPSYSSDVDNGIEKDVVLWRRKKINISVLVCNSSMGVDGSI
ncbi:hypothetical protein JHK86_002183 [Glycine max]|nr:hypothetical protein JHK86_002183 [Glycine max]